MTRRILWFALAYTIVIIVHEGAHALTSALFGLGTTLFQFWVNIDPANQATAGQRAAFGVAGPLSSLVLGVCAWLVYRVNLRSRATVPLLLIAASGVSNFFGNMMSAAFVGDFSNVANWLDLPMALRYAASATGALGVAVVLFVAGRQLARWTPLYASRTVVTLTGVVVPVMIGTGLVILLNQPVPIPGFFAARVGESAIWIFAAAGMFTATSSVREDAGSGLDWVDGVIAVVVFVVVRTMALGIALVP